MSRELPRVAPDKPIILVESLIAERFDAFGVSEFSITKGQFVAARGHRGFGERRISYRHNPAAKRHQG
jgi:hypothetical protein